jgi:hypothetical protein
MAACLGEHAMLGALHCSDCLTCNIRLSRNADCEVSLVAHVSGAHRFMLFMCINFHAQLIICYKFEIVHVCVSAALQ